MNLPTALINELKLYLKQRASNGDLEAQTLLEQVELVATSSPEIRQESMFVEPSEELELGC